MSNSTSNASSGGIGVFGLLGVAFIVLKLTNVIQWSWLWVLAPFWMPVSIFLAIAAIFIVVHILTRGR